MPSVHAIYYSPTGTSRKIALEVASNLAGTPPVKEHELTLTLQEDAVAVLAADELAVIAVPVYAGRVAPLAVKRLRRLQGTETPAVIVVLYGNREYEDALLELYDIANRQSFRVVAAAAFIGEHSFSTVDTPIAQGRPDNDDLTKAADFARRILEKLDDPATPVCARKELPGDDPYTEPMGNIPLTPTVDGGRCTLCGECAEICPAGAIEISDRVRMAVETCTFCCSCIKNCPEEAVSLGDSPPIIEKQQWLCENCSTRKEPDLFV